MRSALKESNRQSFKTNAMAETKYLLMQSGKLISFAILSCRQSFPVIWQMKQSFQSIISAGVDNSFIDNANIHHVELSCTR